MLTETLIYAAKHCPYYTQTLPGLSQIRQLSEAEFKRLPFLTKDIIRKHSKDLISGIVPPNGLSPRKTGGSTGEPLAFWSSGNPDGEYQKFLYELYGYEPGDKILAMDGTLVEDELTTKSIFWKVKNNGNMLPYGGMALSSLYLTDKTMPAYVDFILSYKPDFIRGYPAFITDIARYIATKNIKVDFRIKGIELTSELALSIQVNSIGQAFHTKVFGQYGHTEASVFGYTTDDTFAYYCAPTYGLTEVINENDQQAGIGEEGEIVVTGFSNIGMPFIRYRTGDRAVYGGAENGIVKLNQVLGRTADIIYNATGDKILLTALIFGQHYDALSRIAQWQIVQNIKGEVNISIHSMPGYSQADENEISQAFYTIANIKCDFVYDAEFIKTAAGKVRFVIQNVKE